MTNCGNRPTGAMAAGSQRHAIVELFGCRNLIGEDKPFTLTSQWEFQKSLYFIDKYSKNFDCQFTTLLVGLSSQIKSEFGI